MIQLLLRWIDFHVPRATQSVGCLSREPIRAGALVACNADSSWRHCLHFCSLAYELTHRRFSRIYQWAICAMTSFTTTTRILQGFPVLCKLRLLSFKSRWEGPIRFKIKIKGELVYFCSLCKFQLITISNKENSSN